MHRWLLATALAACAALAHAAYDPLPKREADLSGNWLLNAGLSDDADAMLEERMEEERQRFMRWRREVERAQPPGLPPDPDAGQPPPESTRAPTQRPWQKRRDENYRRMLGITKALVIRQDGTTIDITSAQESRRIEAGLRSQVSMPEGQLADSNAGWDGEWFVIDRRVRKGPRVVEKFRIVRKTGQLEYLMTWSGDTELSGMKVRRIFDAKRTAAVDRHRPIPDERAGALHHECGRGRSGRARITHHRLGLEKFPETFAAPFATVARLLVSAERCVHVRVARR